MIIMMGSHCKGTCEHTIHNNYVIYKIIIALLTDRRTGGQDSRAAQTAHVSDECCYCFCYLLHVRSGDGRSHLFIWP